MHTRKESIRLEVDIECRNLTLLFFFLLLGAPIATKHCPNECVTFVTRAIPQKLLKKYEKSTCGKPGVVFTTVKDRTYCAEPEVEWVQLAMRAIDERNIPSSPTVDKSISEKRVMTPNISGTAGPTLARPTETGGPAHYRTTFFPSVRTGMSSMSTGSFAGSTPQPESATFQPKTIGPTNLPQRRNFTGQSSTPFGTDETKTMTDAAATPSLTEVNRFFNHASLGTSPTSPQEGVIEKNRAAETISHPPDVLVDSLPTILSAYRTHFITLAALGSLLCIPAIIWAFAKFKICTTSSSNEMVQGLLFSPSKYQANVGTNDIL